MSALGRIGALATGCALVLGVSACTSDEEPSAAVTSSEAVGPSSEAVVPSSAPAPATSAAPEGTGAPLQGGRQVVFALAGAGGESMLAVTGTGLVELTEEYSDTALFVPTPVRVGGDQFLIKTGKMQRGGEAFCLKVHSPGASQALRLKIAACDAGDREQVFTFPAATDGSGRLIEVAGLYAFAKAGDPDVVVEEAGEGDFPAFTVVDRGRATIPRLGH
ncbi:hypothetical protein AB0F81_48440 [Actinoplanes sp. NPDC024001]|uniref:hypothetical protein n=1 Tax=Actinoplanes sp. NPDC024001 TaxID=3154598 RepID=UPI0033F27E08